MQELDSSADFDVTRDREFFTAIPARAAVFIVEPRAELTGAQPYLLRTANFRQRLARLLGPPAPGSKRLNLREFAARVRYRVVGSPFELSFLHWQHAREMWPAAYRERSRLRPSALLKVSLTNAYPRCYATRRISASGFYFGPFRSRRAADVFASGFLDLFKIRRCQIKIRRDPSFPGCMYSEMKMCLAPCFAGCTKEEYDVEVQRLVQFLDTGGGSLRNSLEQERETSSEQLDFERAAALHKKIEKLDDALRGSPELPRRIQDLDAVILQRSAEDQSIAIYAVRGGWLAEPAFIRFAEIAGQPRSAEHIFREYLERVAPQPLPGHASADAPAPGGGKNILGEHLWLVARWYYSNPREGEIFFRDKDWPYRRIMRGCSRLLAPKPETGAGNGPPAPAS
jgi:excinuclease ABC subunit C